MRNPWHNGAVHNKTSISADLETLNIPRDATVLVHSSFKSLGGVDGGPLTVIEALSSYFEPGLLVMPTHTWAKVNGDAPVFDVENTSSNVGILGEMFRKQPGVIRTLHPTHSLAVKGKGAQEFASGEENSGTPTTREGCYGKLYDANGYVIFLGVPLTKNTIIHGAEEWADIPDRFSAKPLDLKIKLADGTELDRTMYTHWSVLESHISDTYDKLLIPLLDKKIAWTGKVGDAEVTVAKIGPMIDYTMALLAQQPDVFLDTEPVSFDG